MKNLMALLTVLMSTQAFATTCTKVKDKQTLDDNITLTFDREESMVQESTVTLKNQVNRKKLTFKGMRYQQAQGQCGVASIVNGTVVVAFTCYHPHNTPYGHGGFVTFELGQNLLDAVDARLAKDATFEQIDAAENAEVKNLTHGLISKNETEFFCPMKPKELM